jgi:hypothetical protein
VLVRGACGAGRRGRPVGRCEPGSVDLALQDGELVA